MNRAYFPELSIANAARKLHLISNALGLLDEARTKLAACEDEQFVELAERVESIRLDILKAIREILPDSEGDA